MASNASGALSYDAVLLVGFGGPEGPDDVLPFLQNVTRGRGVPPERLVEVAHHYDHFGGVSPINDQNRALQAALRTELAQRSIDLPVLWGNRNWDPYLADALREAQAAGYRRVLALVTSAYSSYSSCRQYREDLADALAATDLGGTLQIDRVRQYFDHPGFVGPAARGLADALLAMRRSTSGPVQIFFTTHSIPTTMADSSGAPGASAGIPGGVYQQQHLATAQLIIDAAQALLRQAGDPAAQDMPAWQLVYQSRSGPPSIPWLEPDINDAIDAAAANGATGVVLVPSGFVSDHLEVLWDLDEEARETAEKHEMAFARVATVGTDPQFVAAMVDLIEERLDPAHPVQALSELGPWPAVCAPGCCPNLRITKAAAAGTDNGAVVSRGDDGALSVAIA